MERSAEYDPYISYGDETRTGFVGHLEIYLIKKGFTTSKDDPEAIDMCRIFIVVLSKDYPYSLDRLDELVKIVNTAEAKGLKILPVFYYVEPWHVRHQGGDYGEALKSHQNSVSRERYDGWIKAMKLIADIIGFHIQRGMGKDEAQYIEEIYRRVSNYVACTVGLHRRVLEAMNSFNLGPPSDVGVRCILGICGISGIGKSTVARKVHLSSSKEFSHHHLIDKAGEYLKNHGLGSLVSKIVGDDNFDSKEVLKQNKFFLTFEDVDDPEPLQAIIQLTNLLGCGSKVVITAKDFHLLEIYGIERIYKVEKFNNHEAYELLCLKVLKSKFMQSGYVSIITRAAAYASGHPLLLEVIGSILCGKGKKECESMLDQYKKIHNEETQGMLLVQKILQVTFDALEECPREKLVHIAHYLIGNKSKKEVENNLRAAFSGCPKEDMNVLLEKSLIKINEDDQVTLHDLTLDMVRGIDSYEQNVDLTKLELSDHPLHSPSFEIRSSPVLPR